MSEVTAGAWHAAFLCGRHHAAELTRHGGEPRLWVASVAGFELSRTPAADAHPRGPSPQPPAP